MDPKIKTLYWIYFTLNGRAMFKSDGWLEDTDVLRAYNRLAKRSSDSARGPNFLRRMISLGMKDLVNGQNRP